MAEIRHEQRDVNTRAVTKFGLGLTLLIVCSLFGLWLLFGYLLHQEGGRGPAPAGMPPEPRLQASPALDLRTMRAAEDELLNHYSWIDPDKGIVRIPIGRAMDLIAQRGLASRLQAPPPASTATVPTTSGLGPIMQQEGGPLAGPPKEVSPGPPQFRYTEEAAALRQGLEPKK